MLASARNIGLGLGLGLDFLASVSRVWHLTSFNVTDKTLQLLKDSYSLGSNGDLLSPDFLALFSPHHPKFVLKQ